MPTLQITEPALLIRIAKLYKPGMNATQLWEATRGVWKTGIDREKAEYVLSVANGVVQEVYKIGAWQPAGTASYTTRARSEVQIAGRWEFTGSVAHRTVRDKYIGKSIAHYFKRGNANPVNYVNIRNK